ncbi:LuxR C-terminal-related transcriptional regulator [Kitasatospora sp. NPDC002227]|uniref:helix-turn-helix transcriptional regulator n=1 Tax=Kitasatospora sp. NPDC002227 TaxID=3154773 RepID=UPI0033242D23
MNANQQEPDISGGSLRDIANALADLSRRVDHAAELSAAVPPGPAEAVPAPAEEAAGAGGDGQIPSVRHLQGLPVINDEIKKALDGVRFEVLTAQPDGPRPSAVLADALEAVRSLLDRQITMRTLYQHSTRFDEATKEYVRAATRLGAQVRTLPEFFDRVIIVDREVAFIPDGEDRTRATKVTDRSVVHFLADTFDRTWDRAARFPFHPTSATQAATEVMPAVRHAICKLLVEGRSDREIARRLGLSQRSLQSHVARLKEEFGAQHRFQLGYMMGCDCDHRRDMAGFDDLAALTQSVVPAS